MGYVRKEQMEEQDLINNENFVDFAMKGFTGYPSQVKESLIMTAKSQQNRKLGQSDKKTTEGKRQKGGKKTKQKNKLQMYGHFKK